MRRTGACLCCLTMVALIFAAAPAKAGDNSIDVAVIVYDGVLTSDITAPLEVFGKAARKPWLQKINVEAVAADGDLDILTEEGIKLKADRLLAGHRAQPLRHGRRARQPGAHRLYTGSVKNGSLDGEQ